jgi:ketosteroid isomerase-like protein
MSLSSSYFRRLCIVYSGRPYKMMQCFIFVVRDGLIQQIRSFFDTAMGFELIFGDEEPRQLV